MKEVAAVVRAIGRRWGILLLATLVGVVMAVGYGLVRTEQYESVATLAVSTSSTEQTASSAYQSSMAATQRVSTYAEIVTQSDVLPRVAEASNGEFTVEELRDSVGAVAEKGTVLIELRALDEDPGRARLMAELAAAELAAMVTEIETPPGTQVPMAHLTMVGHPVEAEAPVGLPMWLLVLLGLFLGLVAGVLAALVRDYLDRTVRDPETAARTTGVGLLGSLFEEPEKSGPGPNGLSPVNMEAFRHLRTNLNFVDVDHPPRVLLFTSSVPNEGKSFTATRTARVLAEAGHRVILVDADLRMSNEDTVSGTGGDVGLTSVLAGDITVEDAIQYFGGGVDLLPSGSVPPNPSELLGSEALQATFAQLRDCYDFVIVDSPPVLPVADPLVLSPRCDAVVFVTRIGRVKTHQLELAMELLGKTGVRMAGLVVNGVSAATNRAYGYGYGYGYGDPVTTTTSTGANGVTEIVGDRPVLQPARPGSTRVEEIREEELREIRQ